MCRRQALIIWQPLPIRDFELLEKYLRIVTFMGSPTQRAAPLCVSRYMLCSYSYSSAPSYAGDTRSYRDPERKLVKKGKLAGSRLAEQFRENLEARSWRISRFGLEVEAGVTAMSLRRAVHVGKETACSICYNEILSYTVHLTFCFFILPN